MSGNGSVIVSNEINVSVNAVLSGNVSINISKGSVNVSNEW